MEVGKIEFGPKYGWSDQIAQKIGQTPCKCSAHSQTIKNPSISQPPMLTGGGHPLFNQFLAQMSQIHVSKNKDYAGDQYFSNFQVCEDIGIPAWKGAVVRMLDKVSRIKNIVSSNKIHVTDESLENTLLDLANYAVIVLILLREATHDTPAATEENR